MPSRFAMVPAREDRRRGFRRLLGVVLSFMAAAFSGQLIYAEPSPSPSGGVNPVKLFEQYCFECHGDGMDKGSFALDGLLQAGPGETNRFQWVKAWTIVRHGFMPPADADQPAESDRHAITQWIERQRLGVDYDHPDPGRVTVRRLNRMEYEFTIQDLLGVSPVSDGEFSSDASTSRARLRDMLPPDDTAFGFDNNGDFQTLSPELLEKYFNLAEFVVDNVIALDGPRYPMRMLDTSQIKISREPEAKRAEHQLEFEVARLGRYRIDAQFALGGWQDYGGAYDFHLAVDDQLIAQDQVEIGGQRTYKFGQEVTLDAGSHRLNFSTDPTKPNSVGKTNHLELRPKFRLTGPVGGDEREYPESHQRIFFQGSAPTDPALRLAYARAIMRRVADRAFRRPASEAVLDRLSALVMSSDKFESGVGLGLMAVLTSPQFIFRSEVQPQPDDPKSVHPLDEYALASRLSYLLWLSLPDDELTSLAKRGELRKHLPEQVKRMLADSKSERFFEDFPGQWLRTRNVLMTAIVRDATLNPVRGAMKRETELLFEDIARHDRDLLELLTADYTFVDEGLAKFYGLTNFAGAGFQKVSLTADSKRGGILTHGSFLVATSNPNRTSPVKRGVFVLENLLAVHPPPPPPSVPSLDDAKTNGAAPKTGSEQLALHRANKSCAACHAHFDPIGIALENYDVIGQWRTQEAGEAILPNEKTTTGQTLTGIDDLRSFFTNRRLQFYRCMSEKLLTYALGRGLDPGDAVTVDRIADQVAKDNGKFSTLLMAVIESPPFQMRRGDDGIVKTPPRSFVPEAPPPEQRKGRRRNRPVNPELVQKALPATNAVVSPPAQPTLEK
ncbi:MAG TPA: DUF1592 domain-containing protein [Verrucomicrobiota bacterium]|nr:DUF1592 domain-containing protein [Verrucomicrobiota bacterium]